MALLGACKSASDESSDSTAAPATAATSAPTATTAAAAEASGADTTEAVPDTAPPDTEPTVPAISVPPDDRAPGVSDDTIKVGVTYVDLEAIRDVTKANHGDYEAAYNVMFDHINAAGGIHGRMLEPVYSPVNPLGTAGSDAACTKLTQDDEVFVTVGFFLEDAVLCYVDVNQTPVIGGTMTDERLSRATVPWFTTEPGADLEAAAVRLLAEAGELDGTVAVYGQALEQTFIDEQILPVLEELGVNVVTVAYNDAPFDDANAQATTAATIAARLEADGADQVLVVGGAPTSWLDGRGTTRYRPKNVFRRQNNVTPWMRDTSNDFSLLEESVSAGTFPSVDLFESMGPVTQECVDLNAEAGLTLIPANEVPEGEPAQVSSSLTACTQVALLAAMLDGAGPDLNFGTFLSAGYNLGDIELAQATKPYHFGPPPSADGDSPPVMFRYDATSAQFVPEI
jgi:ABC-type branched-subunit amino acid transport system substrate-binding protein